MTDIFKCVILIIATITVPVGWSTLTGTIILEASLLGTVAGSGLGSFINYLIEKISE